MKKTKQEYEIELLDLVPRVEKLEKRRTFLWKKIARFENEEAIQILFNYPENPEELTPEQWKYLLWHDHHVPDAQYSFSTKLFESLGMFTSGFWKDTKQHTFALHSYTDLNKFKKFWELIKDVYLPTTRKNEQPQVNFMIYFDIGNDGWSLEIYADGKARIKNSLSSEAIESLDNVLNKLKIYQKVYESSY